MKHYGIEIIGYGARRRFCIKEIIPERGTNPVNGREYKTEHAAREHAEHMGLTVEAVGDFYALMAAIKNI